MPFEVLATSRSFCRTAGPHHEYLRSHGCRVDLAARERPYGAGELRSRIGAYHGIVLGLDAFDATVVREARRLKVISRYGTGTDNVDLAAATRHGILVTHTPGANARSVAELTIGLMLALVRDLPRAAHALREGVIRRRPGHELGGKELGLIGFGEVGRRVAALADAFGMEVRVHDPYRPEVPAPSRAASLEELLAASDVVSLHAALTPETRGMLDATALAGMKRGAFLVNTARAELVDAGALLTALRGQRLAGAAIDEAIGTEGGPGRELLALDEVVATPHLGATTHEAIARMSMTAAENLVAGLTGAPCPHALNPEVRQEVR